MHVLATAGHVDHGKSTLVRALTGNDPDRLAEEHRRGLSIELGYCWTDLPEVGEVAFVDVPGHERFIGTTLSGVGPVPAVLFVVAADDPWMPQAAEHLAALDALGVEHGILAVTRSDLADPAAATERALAELSGTSLRDVPAVAVSGRTGEGIADLRSALVRLVATLPSPDQDADVRLWVDRRFHIAGAGTVVTGTLRVGRIRAGDELEDGANTVRVRGIETFGRPTGEATGACRAALALGGSAPATLDRGSTLVTPGRWLFTRTMDVRVAGSARQLPLNPVLHVGASAMTCRVRPLDDELVRLGVDRAQPLRIGDRALLRDPGSRRVWGVTVLDPEPPALHRRGAARQRASDLVAHPGRPDLATEMRLRTVARRTSLERLGVDTSDSAPVALANGDWFLERRRAAELLERLVTLVDTHDRTDPLDPGVTVAAAARELDLPTPALVETLVRAPLRVADGRVRTTAEAGPPVALLEAAERLREHLADAPFAAPDAGGLADLGLDTRTVAAAARAGLVLRISDTVVLLPNAADLAVELLAALPQPFTASQARSALATSRRVVLPLLDHLDRAGMTRRLPDDRRTTDP